MEKIALEKNLAPIKAQISKAETAAVALKIKTADDMAGAAEVLSKIKIVGKEIKNRKEAITKPINEGLKSIRAFFAPLEEQWENAERIVKDKMVDYQNAQLAKVEVKKDEIQEKIESGKMSEEKGEEKIAAIIPQNSVQVKSGTVQFRTIKEVVIEDEGKLPREYLVPDMVKIRKVALAGVEIAGVKVVEKQTVAGTTK